MAARVISKGERGKKKTSQRGKCALVMPCKFPSPLQTEKCAPFMEKKNIGLLKAEKVPSFAIPRNPEHGRQ